MDIGFEKLYRRFRPKSVGKPGHDPFHDWKIIIACFLIVNILCVAGSLYLFSLINSGSMFMSATGERPRAETLDRDTLTIIIEEFERKKEAGNALSLERVSSADPSL